MRYIPSGFKPETTFFCLANHRHEKNLFGDISICRAEPVKAVNDSNLMEALRMFRLLKRTQFCPHIAIHRIPVQLDTQVSEDNALHNNNRFKCKRLQPKTDVLKNLKTRPHLAENTSPLRNVCVILNICLIVLATLMKMS